MELTHGFSRFIAWIGAVPSMALEAPSPVILRNILKTRHPAKNEPNHIVRSYLFEKTLF
jgi:hypothetical protein